MGKEKVEKTAEDVYAEMDAIADGIADEPDTFRDEEINDDADGVQDSEEESVEDESGDISSDDEADVLEGDEAGDDDGESDAMEEGEIDESDIDALMQGLDPKDPTQNAIRSHLGRVKNKDRTVEQLQQKIQLLLNSQQGVAAPQGSNQSNATIQSDGDEEEFIDSAKDVERVVDSYLRKKTLKEHEDEQQYVNGFMHAFIGYTEKNGWDDDKQAVVWAEIYGNPAYSRVTGNPDTDCQFNIIKAEKTILERELAAARDKAASDAEKKKPNVRGGGKPQVPLGAGPASKKQEARSASKKIKLDHEAAAFIQSRGISEEQAINILSEEPSAQFTR